MKMIKWKILLITVIVCILPVLLGLILWDKLPDTMPIHFNIYNEADNFSSKGFAVFILPLIMVVVQLFSCFIYDINAYNNGERIKFERVVKWIIPVMTIILQTIIIGYSLGYNIDIRRVVALLVGVMFIVLGNYFPKLDYVKNYDVDTSLARKINRFIGIMTVVLGFIFLISAFLPPVSTIISLFLLIPYGIITFVYSIVLIKRNK
ncbi:MAG: DUF1648 domain-containing protein [Clostridia bacterium]|nr:DUF1648 domain-containing protein [Clostridia bacterium]